MAKLEEEKQQHQQQIVAAITDLKSDQAEAQNIKAKADEVVEQMPEFETVVDLEAKLEDARERLKQAKLNNPDYQGLQDSLVEARTDVNVSRKALSSLLVQYTAKYQERSVLLGNAMHEIVLTGKVGKDLGDIQEALPLWE